MIDKIESCYIHIPFCNKICNYCDFCKMYYDEKFVKEYLLALDKEIDTYYKGEILNTLYIGGGTPSSLKINELNELFKIIEKLKLNNNYEFTFECNIEDINEEFLIFLKNNKVNRISIGIESFNKKILNILGRSYDFDIKEKISLVKRYFDNINIDLIYGVNGQTIKDLKYDLDKFLELDVTHISIYSLILENNTILKVNNYKEIDEDLNRDMYEYILKVLKDNNYIHYEISNFSKEGYSSKHNLVYWDNKRYYGFGLGASGYIDNIRYTNTRSINKYINNKFRYIEEDINEIIDMDNFMILGLRKIKGVSKEDFYNRYSKDIEEVYDVSKLSYNNGYYYIKEDDLYISNSILCDFITIIS